ncbi:hypothetical protein NM208_g4568 [Fusarium decemcellulare]|uniref:Uncharacterized protein n=2 Tax=Fusarium decemcellulare TaxID=57161 RepID=A0ACC1SKP0_9HYPO|nr:hypothetical protein NM208_g7495 [Fusarium decemcellulare]KAJ3541540.1 hypothetical protein NM208_g4568 [Fusarium decemcellulare]
MASQQGKPKQACDNCRFRKVKCDRGMPCRNCNAGELRCLYQHNVRRRGPKEGQGRRQSQLRRGLVSGDGQFQILTPESRSGLGTRRSNERTPCVAVQSQPSTPFQNPVPLPQPDLYNKTASSPDNAMLDVAGYSRRLALSLVAHVQLFLNYLFPIMPVVDGDELLSDAARLDELPPSRYALIAALCAATRMQLRLDKAETGLGADIPADPQLSGEMLINLAENALRQYSVIDDTGLDSMLASFFLFASYGNLNNARHAWFYLNQSITLAQSLDITREAGYYSLPEPEREKRRRVFWLLFVTERTFALQHRRSVMLRSSITKPQVVDSDCPIVMHDFINHIRLFESLPWSLYEWQPESDSHRLEDLKLVHTINDKLCTVQADHSVIESQRFDTLITQQWLRVSMWRLAFGNKPSSACNFGLLLPPGLPMDAGKIIMSALGSVGQKSKDCHGIGMEQKLFDVGMSLADSALLPSWSCSSIEAGPRDLLCAVIDALSTVRGCQSHLLPKLLKHSEGLLAFTNPVTHINMRLEPPQDVEKLNPSRVIEEISAQDDELGDPLSWITSDDLGLLDMSTPRASPSWEDPVFLGEAVDAEVGISL